MAITTKQQRQQRRSEALQLIADGVPPTDAARINRSRHSLQTPAEISDAHLRVGMDPLPPVPLASELQAKGMTINKLH